MTQAQLAAATGGDPANISAMEHGHRDAQSYKIAALALVLACSADYLLGLCDDPTPFGRSGRLGT